MSFDSYDGEPAGLSDEELMELMPQQFRDDLATVSRMAAHGACPDVGAGLFRVSLNTGALEFARTAIAADRAQRQPVPPEPEGPTDEDLMEAFDGEFAEFFDSSDGFGTTAIPRSEWIKVARAVLTRWGRQVPIETKFNIKWALDALERLRDASMRYRLGVFSQEELQLYEDRAQKVIEAWSRGDEHEMSGSDATPQPVPPEPGEVQGLVKWLRELGAKRGGVFDVSTFCANLTRAAELLSQRHPQPVPVSERPWEREGWCDDQGKCWWFNPGQPAMSNPHIATSSWRLCRMLNGKPMGAYSLPAHALPLPGEVEG